MKEVCERDKLPADVALQVGDMVAEAVDQAIRQLLHNGGGAPQTPSGYLHPARTAEEVRATAADESTGVPSTQQAETDGMPEDLAAIVNRPDTSPISGIVTPDGSGGWKF